MHSCITSGFDKHSAVTEISGIHDTVSGVTALVSSVSAPDFYIFIRIDTLCLYVVLYFILHKGTYL